MPPALNSSTCQKWSLPKRLPERKGITARSQASSQSLSPLAFSVRVVLIRLSRGP